MKQGYLRVCVLVLLCLLGGLPFTAHAAVSEKDVLVIGRIIGLLDNAPKGIVPIALIQSNISHADTKDIANIIGSGKTIGALTLVAMPVTIEQLSHTQAQVIYVPQGLNASELGEIFAVAKQRKLVTISTADSCLKLQKCAISITSDPAVDIRLSVSASAATNVAFGSTFRMMVKEVQ